MLNRIRSQIILGLLLAGFVCPAQEAKLRRQLSHVPPPVRKTIRAHLGGATLEGIDKNTDDGEVTYDVSIVRAGKERGFTVDSDGEMVDEQVFLDELPAAVQQGVRSHLGVSTLDEIDKSEEDGNVTYDVEITRHGQSCDFTLDDQGRLVNEEVLLMDLPAKVQQTIQKQLGAGALNEIDKSNEDGEVSYSVEMTAGDKTRSFTVGATGDLVDVEMFMTELPAAVQAAIQKETSGGAPEEIRKCFDEDEVSYDVDLPGDKACTLSFDEDGSLFARDEEVELAATPEPVQRQIAALAAGGKVLGVSKVTEDGEVSYDAGIADAGGEKTVSIDSNGNLVKDDSN